MKKTELLEKILISLFVICILLLLLEFILFLTTDFEKEAMHIILQKDDIDYMRNSKNPYLSYELVPNTYNQDNLIINSLGFRDYERNISKTKFRICVIGDSVTYGIGVGKNETFSYILEKKLNKEGYDVEVWNMGVPAYNSIQKNIMVRKAINEFNADLIIYQYFSDDNVPTGILYNPIKHKEWDQSEHILMNEIDSFATYFKNFFPFPEKINEFFLKNSYVYRFVNQKIENIINRISKKNNSENSFITYKRNMSEKYNYQAVEDSLKIGSGKMLVFIPPIIIDVNKQPKEFPVLKKLSEKYNIPFLNLIEIIEIEKVNIYGFRSKTHPEDDAHPNYEGHKFYAEKILKEVKEKKLIINASEK